LLTKADKLKKGAASKQLLSVRKALKDENFEVSVQMFSALKKTGIDELQNVLNRWFDLES
jgi:GTP-binding protein